MATEVVADWTIQLVQISEEKDKNQYLPYAAGLLQAYAQQYALGPFRFLPILFQRRPLQENLQQALTANVLGFSCYVWNVEYSLALAQQVKAANSGALIIFGGPQIPDRAEAFLRQYPFIDVVSHGEGEKVFVQLLQSLPDRDWTSLSGISFLDSLGTFQHHPPAPRIQHLDEIPSPYLAGVFDFLLEARDIVWLAPWETTRGCPFSCTFCDWGSNIASKVRRHGLDYLQAEIDWFASRRINTLYCCDANFGILPRDIELAEALIAVHQRTGYPRWVMTQNAKNVTDRTYTIQQRMAQAGLSNMVTLSLQSISPQTLKAIKRDNISLETYRELQRRFRHDGIQTYTDLIMGLPGESYDSFVDGVSQIIAEGQHHWIFFFNVYVLPNAELAQPAYRREHGIETQRIPYSDLLGQVHQEVPEWQEMVIATATLNRDDWRRVRTFAWWVRILYFRAKLLQLPLLLLHQLAGVSFRQSFEFFNDGLSQNTPMLTGFKRFLDQKALYLQRGQDALDQAVVQGPDSRWVQVEDHAHQMLQSLGTARKFFAEAGLALHQLLAQSGRPLPEGLLAESLRLSEAMNVQGLLMQPLILEGRYNLWEYYQGCLRGDAVELRPEPCRYLRAVENRDLYELTVEKIAGNR